MGFGTGSSGGASFVGPLDAYSSNLVLADSVAQRLLTSFTGPLFNVRRSSDNSSQDIYPLASGLIDTNALLSFCGSGSGFITKTYNQVPGGSANDPTQSTSALQPRIVNAGTLDVVNAVAAIRYGGTQFLQSALNLSQPFSIFGLMQTDVTAVYMLPWSTVTGICYAGTGTSRNFVLWAGAAEISGGFNTFVPYLLNGKFNGAHSGVLLNNTPTSSGNAGTGGFSGTRFGGITSAQLNGWMGTNAIYSSIPANSTAISSALGAIYSL
jgi:hypothetical protein